MTATAPHLPTGATNGSLFAGLNLARAAGFALRPGGVGPVFDQDLWDFSGVAGLPAYAKPSGFTLDFRVIREARWRRVAKEFAAALLLPRHDAVAQLSWAYRTARTIQTCKLKLHYVRRWFEFLADHKVASLADVDDWHTGAFVEEMATLRGRSHQAVSQVLERKRTAARTVIELVRYAPLYSADTFADGFVPFGGRQADTVVGKRPNQGNCTPVVPADTLQPLLAAVLYISGTLAPHILTLAQQRRAALEHGRPPVGVTAPIAAVQRADRPGRLRWTRPLNVREAARMPTLLRTACLITVAAVSGMRSSELAELTRDCQVAPQRNAAGLVRYRLASTLIKGQPLGGVRDEWVVAKSAYDAAGIAARLADGDTLFQIAGFGKPYEALRRWVNGPAGRRLGLAPIPGGAVSLRMLRRTLAVELAYRPGGLLAAKIHLRHVSVATTEGYANRPGGAQGRFLAEVGAQEQQRSLDLVLAAYRDHLAGIQPSGPGARGLLEFFDSVDGKLGPELNAAPHLIPTDQAVKAMLMKRAATLHLGTANYCWFADPAKALCLRLAGTPTADRPLIGMCDSARCPQATHHPCHRPVWAEAARQGRVFLGQLGRSQSAERARLGEQVKRAERVLDAIDAAAGSSTQDRAVG
jgi:integrase